MRPSIAASAPRSFVDIMTEADDKARELRDLLLELMAAPPGDEAAWLALMTEPGTAKGLGRLLIATSKNSAWITEITRAIGDQITTSAPAETARFLESFVAGEVEAEMACPCGECVPCTLRKTAAERFGEQGDEAARAELVRQYSAPIGGQGRRRSGLVGPDGQPLQ